MNNRGLTLLEVLAILVVIAILGTLLLPLCCGVRPARRASCQNNLHHLHVLGTVYAKSHHSEWPKATGKSLWLSFRTMTPPLIEPDHAAILHCDVQDHDLGPDQTNYRGPRVPFTDLKGNEPLAADAEGNHGEGEGFYVLFKNGSVQNASPGDALWKKCRETLSP